MQTAEIKGWTDLQNSSYRFTMYDRLKGAQTFAQQYPTLQKLPVNAHQDLVPCCLLFCPKSPHVPSQLAGNLPQWLEGWRWTCRSVPCTRTWGPCWRVRCSGRTDRGSVVWRPMPCHWPIDSFVWCVHPIQDYTLLCTVERGTLFLGNVHTCVCTLTRDYANLYPFFLVRETYIYGECW